MLQRVNDTLRQCLCCGKVTNTVKRKPSKSPPLPAAPDGYVKAAVLAERYGVTSKAINQWAHRGLVSRYGLYHYWEKDVAACADHLHESVSKAVRTSSVNTRGLGTKVKHGSMSYYGNLNQ
jgi:hypothetical protein